MLVYSRKILVLLQNSAKFLNKISKGSHGSFHRRPLPSYVWEKLASYNLLAARRGQRGGQQLRSSYRQHIKTVTFTDRNKKRLFVQNTTNRSSQLNIQVDTLQEAEQQQANIKQRNGHVPSNCIKISTTTEIKSAIPSLLVTNACHITNKIDELQGVVENNNVTITIVTESWLSSEIPNSSTSIGRSYITYRKDRENKQGGGVIAYIKSDLKSKRIATLEDKDKEVLWLRLYPTRIPRPHSCIIGAGVYFPPGKNAAEEKDMTNYLTQCLDKLLQETPSSGILLAGDFNHLDLSCLCRRFSLRKGVHAPTRGDNVLDQILTNMSDLFDSVIHLPPLGRSDHQCLLMQPKMQVKLKATTREVRSMKPGNLANLTIQLNKESWEEVFNALDLDRKVVVFTKILNSILDATMPVKKIRMHPSDRPWMTPRIKSAIKERQRVFVRGKTEKYQHLRQRVATMIKKAKLKYYEDRITNTRASNPAKWFKSIYGLCGAVDPIQNAPTTEDLSEVAEKLQDVFTRPWDNHSPSFSDIQPEGLPDHPPKLPSIGLVKAFLNRLNARKATGADNIPAWILKKFSEELAPVVHNIITTSIIEAKYPTLYKHALVSPVPKVHPPEDIEKDFRQISVVPILGKVLERVQIFLNKSALTVAGSQHAFTQGRSTVSALINITQSWFNDTDNSQTGRNGIHALFLDFRKAFDLVDHSILLSKLKTKNINKNLWMWIQSFLSNRTQQVKLPGTLSTVRSCPAGVPQGSVLSPLLFNIHIDDIDDAIPIELHDQVRVCKYADDCTATMRVPRGEESKMQAVLNSFQIWADNNGMSLNTTKTKDMWICFLLKGTSEPEKLELSEAEIERVPTFKLLGVWQQDNLRWNEHINQTTKKANKRLYYLRDCRKAQLPQDVGITVYRTKIRPLLEYASPVWGGIPDYLVNELQRVQNRSLDIIGVPRNTLPELASRRDKAAEAELRRVLSDPNHPNFKFIKPRKILNTNLRSASSDKLSVPLSRTSRHSSSFLPRASRLIAKK